MTKEILKTPKFSVIMASYNHEKFIAQAIESVLSQSGQDLEIILVDDGSKDGSWKIITDYQKKYSMIRVFSHENFANKGIPSTYQLGISKSKGEYLAFLEVDDIWHECYLKKKSEIFSRYSDVGIIFSPYRILREGFRGIEMSFRQWCLQLLLVKNRPFDNFKPLLRKNNIATFSSFVVRKSELDGLTLPSDSRLLFYDWWFLSYLSLRTLFYLDTSSYIYWRQHQTSALGEQNFEKHRNTLINFYAALYHYLEKNISNLDSDQHKIFEREAEKLPFFFLFYKNPSFYNFIKFSTTDLVWSIDSLVSYIINRCKYR